MVRQDACAVALDSNGIQESQRDCQGIVDCEMQAQSVRDRSTGLVECQVDHIEMRLRATGGAQRGGLVEGVEHSGGRRLSGGGNRAEQIAAKVHPQDSALGHLFNLPAPVSGELNSPGFPLGNECLGRWVASRTHHPGEFRLGEPLGLSEFGEGHGGEH